MEPQKLASHCIKFCLCLFVHPYWYNEVSMHLPIALLALSSLFAVGMTLFRISYAHTLAFSFMMVNITLAWIPFLLSLSLYIFLKHKNYVWSFLAGSTWMLFFPNSFYIATDIIWLKPRPI